MGLARSLSIAAPHVGPLTAELGTTVWEGRVNTRRLCPAHRDCAQAARAGLGKYTILIFVQVKFNCREVISNHLSNNRLRKDSNRRIAISSVLNGWRITRSEERQQTRAEPARQRVARRRERASEQRRGRALNADVMYLKHETYSKIHFPFLLRLRGQSSRS